MPTPSELVTDTFSQAQDYVVANNTRLTDFTNALNAAIPSAPTISATFVPIDAPTNVSIPDRPPLSDSLAAQMVWDTSNIGLSPDQLSLDAPTITIDDFTDVEPDVTLGDAPVLDFGTKPTLDFGTKPTAPTLDDVTVLDAPTPDAVSLPSLLTFTTPTLASIDLHSSFLTNLDTVPSLDLVAPTAYSFQVSEAYKSGTLEAFKTALIDRYTNGGTGLNLTVEAGIVASALDRESKLAQAAVDEVQRANEALGYVLPTGVATVLTLERTDEAYGKVAGASREIAIKQAEMEQENFKQAFELVTQLEVKLVDNAYQMERLAFESAKQVSDNAVEIYNAQVGKFKVTVEAYQAYASAYDTIIKGELAKIDIYKAELQGEQTKADINRSLVEQYKAQIEASQIIVSLYQAQIEGAKARIELQGARLSAYREEINAYVAGVNGETARIEAYKVGVQAEATKVEAYKAEVDSKLAVVQVFDSKVRAFAAKASAQGERARAQVAYYGGRVQAKEAEVRAYAARVQTESDRFRALAAASGVVLDAYKAELQTNIAKVDQDVRRWEIGIKQYEAEANYTLAVGKANADILQATRAVQLDAAKAGAQVYGQLTSASMGLMHVQASVGATASDQVGYNYQISYSYGGDVSSNPTAQVFTPVTSI